MPAYKHSGEIKDILSKFRHEVPGVLMAAAISQDGILLGTDTSDEFTQESFSFLSASMISLASRSTVSLDMGDPQQICLLCENGIILLTSIAGRGSLCCIASKAVKLGVVLLEMKRACADLSTYVYPVNYGTAFLNPDVLDAFEREHAPTAPLPERPIPFMHTELFFRQGRSMNDTKNQGKP
jgi:predicted regulator of Ras-like GTPase activity (Roadblock/LC7/MglB family)